MTKRSRYPGTQAESGARGGGAVCSIAVAACLAAACGGDGGPAAPPEEPTISVVADRYLDAALDIMEANSIKRYEIAWPTFRADAYAVAGAARTTADTYDAIRFALRALGDGHSFFRPPGLALVDGPAPQLQVAARVDPTASLLEGDLGYVTVPAFTGSVAAAHELATLYHRLIEGVDTLGPCGWVVDLRGNTGGNMWPMIAGVGPIVGEGTLGFFVDPDSVVQTWTYQSGSSRLDDFVITESADVYRLRVGFPPVAVLTDSLTASSGEATTIAFRGRAGARSFGAPTWGVSTANRGFPLTDGAMIFLTVSYMADRTGTLYGERVLPDEPVAGGKTGDPGTDAPLRAAMGWLREREACGGS